MTDPAENKDRLTRFFLETSAEGAGLGQHLGVTPRPLQPIYLAPRGHFSRQKDL